MGQTTKMLPDIDELRIEKLRREEFDRLDAINFTLFNEKRVINRTDHTDLVLLSACIRDIIIGFKVGYGKKNGVFYSAKGGVLPDYRRKGVAKKLLDEMMSQATLLGYSKFVYDTFPNHHPGMLVLGLNRGFRVTEACWNPQYNDFQISLSASLNGME